MEPEALLGQVEAGEDVVIVKGGEPVARLTRYRPAGGHRTPGALRGQIEIKPDFDELPEDLETAFAAAE